MLSSLQAPTSVPRGRPIASTLVRPADVVKATPRMVKRFLLERFGLLGPQTFASVGEVVERLEYVQMDSIEVTARVHDLILWSRVRNYQSVQLAQYLYESRQGFEYYSPNLCVLPTRDLRLYTPVMQRWAAGREGYFAFKDAQEASMAEELVEEIRQRGALHPREFTHQARTINGWGSESRLTTHLLEKLYAHGRLGIAYRTRFDRHYDLMSRLYPSTEPLDERWAASQRALKQARAWRVFKPGKLLNQGLDPRAVVALEAEGLGRGFCILREDVPLLEQAETFEPTEQVQLLAPLEPLIYDRERTRALFQFDYTWEVYTPQARRKWGYYVLPILFGERLVGRLDAKLDRKNRTLQLLNLSLEPGESAELLAEPLSAHLRAFAAWLGAERLSQGSVQPAYLATLLNLPR